MPTVDVPHPPGGSWLLVWLRWRMVCTSGRALLATPVKLAVIVGVWTVLLVLIYWLSVRGLIFLSVEAGLGAFLLDRLWYLFLFVVGAMLIVSQLASAYSTLVRSSETRWWMTLPLSARVIARAKWLESSIYSAWAVLLLVVPLGLAYLHALKRPLWLMVWLLGGLMVPLLALLTSVATLALLGWLRWVGRVAVRRDVLAVGFVLACWLLFWALGERQEAPHTEVWFVALQELLPRMRMAMAPWMPTAWVAKAFNGLSTGQVVVSVAYASLLWSTALLCWRVLDHVAHRVLFPVLWRLSQPGEMSAPSGGTASLAVAWWMQRPWRALWRKDLLLVVRDPMQWTQGVVFFGLLGAYFANIHRMAHFSVEPAWRIGVACLNLACTLLVFGSLAIRFLFPQMSLEGRSLWVIQMTPRGTTRLLIAKMALYSLLAAGLIEGLLWLSATRLEIPFVIGWWLGLVGVLASVTLVAMAVGLGAWWIDPNAQDPARVVSSSYGALALVWMLGYVGCVAVALELAWTTWTGLGWVGMAVASLGLAIISGLMGGIPIRNGLARLNRLE